MKVNNINEFSNGWLCGDFTPSLFKNKHVEIGHLKLKKGHKSDEHYHLFHLEHNYILNGQVLIENYGVLNTGDIFTYEPGERSIVEYLQDTDLIVIKHPAVKNDKHY